LHVSLVPQIGDRAIQLTGWAHYFAFQRRDDPIADTVFNAVPALPHPSAGGNSEHPLSFVVVADIATAFQTLRVLEEKDIAAVASESLHY